MSSELLEQWQKLELLHSSGEVRRLRSALFEQGRGVTRHHNPEQDLFALVLWQWGVGNYTRLLGRDDFLREVPGEANLVAYLTRRGKRVEFGGVALKERLRLPERLGEHRFLALFLEQTAALRKRCGLGSGYLVQLDRHWLAHVESLALFDRRTQFSLLSSQQHRPGAPPAELVDFDRRMEEAFRGQ